MVICQYFLKGDCRFGDKCRYEHPSGTKKSLCPYFLRGTCRFGDKCRNEHPAGGGSQRFGVSSRGFSQTSREGGRSLFQNQNRFEALSSGTKDTVNFGGQHSRASDSEQTISQIRQTIQNDMEVWERSKQWPLSCYTYTKEEPCLQGLLDFCPEEIRLEAYTANAKGNADIYEHGLKQLISENHKRRHYLSKMTVSQIQEEIKKNNRLQSEPVAINTGFSLQQKSNGMFSGSDSFSQAGGPSFQSSGSFGAGSSTNQPGLFGQTSPTSFNAGTPFSGSSNSTNQTSGGLFGTSSSGQSAAGVASLFNSGTPFGGSSNSTNQTSGGLFGVSSAGQSAAGDVFGSVPSAQSTGIFSTESKPKKDSRSISESPNISANSLKTNLATTSSAENSSKVEPSREKQTLTCSEQDIQAFMADSFTLGKIPECPPPLELC